MPNVRIATDNFTIVMSSVRLSLCYGRIAMTDSASSPAQAAERKEEDKKIPPKRKAPTLRRPGETPAGAGKQ